MASIIIAVLVLVLLIWIMRPEKGGVASGLASTSASLSSENEVLMVEEANNYDFGRISMAAGKVAHQFKIKNTNNETVTIEKMYTSCMCTTATLTAGDKVLGPYGMPGHGAIPRIDQLINPNEEVTVEVVFDPAAHGPAGVGRIQRTVTIENNGGEPVELQFVAMVTP